MGVEVQEAADGQSGLERWAAGRPQLVFMDGEAATAESLRALLKAYRLEDVLALTERA
jgi:hypothetical protein